MQISAPLATVFVDKVQLQGKAAEHRAFPQSTCFCKYGVQTQLDSFHDRQYAQCCGSSEACLKTCRGVAAIMLCACRRTERSPSHEAGYGLSLCFTAMQSQLVHSLASHVVHETVSILVPRRAVLIRGRQLLCASPPSNVCGRVPAAASMQPCPDKVSP